MSFDSYQHIPFVLVHVSLVTLSLYLFKDQSFEDSRSILAMLSDSTDEPDNVAFLAPVVLLGAL